MTTLQLKGARVYGYYEYLCSFFRVMARRLEIVGAAPECYLSLVPLASGGFHAAHSFNNNAPSHLNSPSVRVFRTPYYFSSIQLLHSHDTVCICRPRLNYEYSTILLVRPIGHKTQVVRCVCPKRHLIKALLWTAFFHSLQSRRWRPRRRSG